MNKVSLSIKEYLVLYAAFARVTFLTQLEYRGQYFVRMLSKIVAWSSGFITILIMLNQFNVMGNWTKYEILFLYGMDMLSYSIAGTFFMGPFGKLPRLIQRGELDQVLLRPVNPMIYLICTKVSAGYTSNYIIGVLMIAICIQKLSISFRMGEFLWFVMVMLGATLIHAAAFIFTAVPAFWILKSDGLADLFYRNLERFISYPLTIYSRGIQILLTFLLPYAFINYYPSQMFLGKQELLPSVFQYLTPFIGVVLFWASYQFWKKGLEAYQGTGS